MEELMLEYREALKQVKQMREKSTDPGDRAILGSIVGDLQYAIRWMRSGREPGSIRGIERRAAYQREIPFDPLWFQIEEYCQSLYPASGKELPEPRRFEVEEALRSLSPREKEVYELSRGEGFTSEEIGEMLGIKSGTVRTMIRRAEGKIRKQKEGSLILVG